MLRKGHRGALALGIAAVFLGLPRWGFAAGPCDCKDIPDIESFIQTTRDMAAAWEQVMTAAQAAGGMTLDQAKAMYDQVRQHQSAEHAGVPDSQAPPVRDVQIAWYSGFFTCTPEINPDFKAKHCDLILQPTLFHEVVHCATLGSFLAQTAAIMADGMGGFKAWGEAIAYRQEVQYIDQVIEPKLQALKAKCTWRCKCTSQSFTSARACAQACPAPSMKCISPTCLEIDPKTGKWTGKGY